MTKQDKVEKVMHEWKTGTLTSNGKQVTDYDQALAIALSEAGLSKNMEKGGKMNKYEKGRNMNKYAKGGAVDAPKIYVADLEAYNNGKLVGEWLDLSDFEDGKDVSKEISKLLKKWGAEEYAIHDVENVPSSIYSEYMGEEDFDKIIKIYKASEENDLPYEVISEIILQYEPEDLEEWISEHYEGHFDNDTDLAYNVVENVGGVSDLGEKTTEMYFDYEGFGRDLAINDEWEGDFDSDEDRGYDYVENMGGVSELGDKTIDMYFDYEKFGRDLAINDYTEIEDGYYFRSPRYAKGGLTNERRYVNKSQNYEVRYAKNRLKRTGYKNERKFAVGGEIGNTVTFSRYGERTTGRVTDKLRNGYEVVTDEGTILVEPQEVISFSDEPIAKKKRFGFFEGGGEIQSKIEKLKKVVSSKMLPESVKAKAQAEIDKLEKELHESKETKAEEKEEHKAGLWKDRKEKIKVGDFVSFDGGFEGIVVAIRNNIHDLKLRLASGEYEDKRRTKSQLSPSKLSVVTNDMKEAVENLLHESKETKAEEKEEHKAGGAEYKSKTEKDLEKELHRLQRDLNSSRLLKYIEGDDSEEEKARQRERASKLNRFTEIIELLNKGYKGSNKEENPIYKELYAKAKKYKLEKKEEHEYFDKRKSELVKSKHKGEKEISFIKSEKVTEIENGKESENFFKAGEAIYGTIVSENSKQYLVKSSNIEGVEYLVNKDAVKLISVKAPSKPTTRKAPVRKAVVKKKVEGLKPKFKVGDVVLVNYGEEKGVIGAIETVAYYEKYPQSMKPTDIPYYEIKGAGKEISENNLELYKAPKADHKKLVAKLKAKKGGKEYDNRASLVPFTDKRRERSESSDKKRSALPPGKRVSENGVTYYESRLNRTDLSKKDKFEKGGEVKGSDWGLNLNW